MCFCLVCKLKPKIKSIPVKHFGECVICLENLHLTQTIALPCAHIFHEECIKKWRMKNNTCPICGIPSIN